MRAQLPEWSPAMRPDCEKLLPHFQGSEAPHSHMLKPIARPVALRALDMLPSADNAPAFNALQQRPAAEDVRALTRAEDVAAAAPVHLDVIDLPAGEEVGVLLVVPERAGAPAVVAGLFAHGRVPESTSQRCQLGAA